MLFLSPIPLLRLLMAAAATNSSVWHLIVRARDPELILFNNFLIRKTQSPPGTCRSMRRLAGVLRLSIKLMKQKILIVFVWVLQQWKNSLMVQLQHHLKGKERGRWHFQPTSIPTKKHDKSFYFCWLLNQSHQSIRVECVQWVAESIWSMNIINNPGFHQLMKPGTHIIGFHCQGLWRMMSMLSSNV